MAITAYTGLPRSGKSYSVVEHVLLPALKMGKRVWTNIPLHLDEWPEDYRPRIVQFKVQEVVDNPGWFQEVFEKGAVCVLDEVWRLWPSGLKASTISEGHKSFFAEHGHMVGDDGYATEIVLVTQDLSQIATFCRDLVETTYRTTKLTSLGSDKRFRVDVYQGPIKGPNPPASKRLREMYGKYDPKVYRLYQSHTMSDTGGAGNESVSDGRKSILKGTMLKVILATVVIGPVLVIWLGSKVVDSYASGDVTGTAEQVRAVTGAQGAPAAASQPVAVQRAAPRMPSIFDGRRVYISLNIGRFPDIEYRFAIVAGNSQTEMTSSELANLGYTVLPFNPCLVRIRGGDFDAYVYCEREEEKRNDFLGVDLATSSAS